MRATAADQARNDGLEGGVREKLLGFRRDLRFFRSLIAFQSSQCCGDECGTVEVCIVFLDTLTPEFVLYVRLRERQQWDSDFPEFVFSRLVLRPEALEVPGMDLQLCVCRCSGGAVLREGRMVRPSTCCALPFLGVGYGSVLVFSALDINSGLASSSQCCGDECGTVEVCVVFLDTLTPEFVLYVRLRERQQWDSDIQSLFSVACSALIGAPARDPRGARHGPAAVCLQVWCWLVSTVVCLYLVERQLDLSSVTTRLRGCSCVVLSGLDIGLII
ncbi:hypothetical protein Taro_020175 [Colocasia esculenta]|uniref:Uncharacterized protein n=1 Tax=Colocasia esculenta TaxID=4460 RepID=A0A843V7Q9_COLES|nr:hypothetical protein [Colocasia esculenta]